jgi:predicted glycosyltransferase
MFPALNYSQAEWASRSCCLWMLPAVMRVRAAEIGAPEAGTRLDEIEAYQRELVIEDITLRRPTLVFVEIGPGKQAFGDVEFDYLAYFMSDPRFASLWSEYDELVTIPNYRVFKRRRPDAGDAASSAG